MHVFFNEVECKWQADSDSANIVSLYIFVFID